MAFFDPTRRAYRIDPYPALASLRASDPVHWSSDLKGWVPTRFAECSEVLHDGTRFTSDPAQTIGARAKAISAHRAAAPLGNVPHLGSSSGDLHRELRHMVNPVFTPSAVRSAQVFIEGLVEELLDQVPAGNPFDFMQAFANPLPREVMRAVIGCPGEEDEQLHQALSTIEIARSSARPGSELLEAARTARTTAVAVLERHRGDTLPAETVLGSLMRANGGSPELTADEIASVAAQISTVGSDPTSGALGNSVAALATRPQAMEALRSHPETTRTAVHELLRYDSPTHIVPRFAVVDCELGGKRIRRGDTVLAVIGAANRDPAEFPNPDELDLTRDARRQLGFGQGEHVCLGASLALAILETALAALLRRFESIELVSPPEFGTTIQLRVPDRLILRCG